MTTKACRPFIGVVVAAIIAAANFGCGGNSAGATGAPPVSVSVSQTTATVLAGAAAQFTATASNDSANQGVAWTVSCSVTACGSVSSASTASGAPTTYTAPGPPASDLTVKLTATSVADPTKSASATITVPAITVSLSATSVNVPPGLTAQFSASVGNDQSNGGVTWSLTQNGTSCSPGCGTVAPSATASGAATTYTAPTTAPASSTPLTLTATSVGDPTKSASATITNLTISVAPSSASVPSGGTQQFTATVTDDPSNGGVTWSLTIAYETGCPLHCQPHGSTCSTCGTVSPASTASGAATNYTAPATPPLFPANTSNHFVGLLAISVTNTNVFTSAPITILPISVSVSPTLANVALNATQQFTATVTNDATNNGVTWSVKQNGVVCSPGCGTVSPASTASGGTATYTAPATAPTLPVVTVTATSIEDATKSGTGTSTLTTSTGGLACSAGSGSESLLKGQYAFLLQTFDSQDGGLGIAGSVTADGTGKITGGEEDIEFNSGGAKVPPTISAAASSYAVGPDHRGCLLLAGTTGETTFLRFALGSINTSGPATTGHVVEFDDTTGTRTRAAGALRLQDPTSFMASQFKGNHAVGMVGRTPAVSGTAVVPGTAIAGTFAADGISAITSGNFDISLSGAVASNVSSDGSFTCCDANGRASGILNNANITSANFVVYMINSGDAFLMVNNDLWGAAGEAIGIPSGTTFSQSSLNGAAVLRETAQSSSGPVVDIAIASADGTGAITVNDNINNAGAFSTSSNALNYQVASNGRVAVTGSSSPPVIYLYGQNQGFVVGTDPNVTFGILEPQAAGPFSDASFSGTYMFGTENPSASTVTLESGVVTADGSGTATGTSDQSSSAGIAADQSFNYAYSISADGTGNVGSGTTAIVISGNKLVFIKNTSTAPTITVVEK